MIIIYEELCYQLFFKIIIIKIFHKKKINFYYIEKNKYNFINYLNNNFFKISQLYSDITSLKNMDNSCILNYIEKNIFHKAILYILKSNQINNNNYFLTFYKFRLLQNYKLPNSNKSLLEYLIIIYAIDNIYKNNYTKNIELYLFKFIYRNELIDYVNKKNIKIKTIRNFNLFNLITHILNLNNIKIILKKFINKFYSLYDLLFYNHKTDEKFDSKIVLELSLNMNNPKYFFNKNLDKKNYILVNRFNRYTNIEKENILNSNISYQEIKPKLFLYNNFYKIFSLNIKKKYTMKLSNSFNIEKKIWKRFFNINNAFIYYFNGLGYDHSIAACSAIHDLNGISVFSQTSYHSPNTLCVCADIFFTFSPDPHNLLIKDLSNTKYIIKAGYTHDYNFKINKNKSRNIRKKLINNGATKIIAFFDQGHLEDSLYDYGYYNSSLDYEFLFNKLIENPLIGLIIKPKKPKLLHLKIKRIIDLYYKALKTGRLYINLELNTYSVKDFDNPPCVAAMASNISIHSTPGLNITAGIESYLSNTPTIFLDRMNYNSFDIKNTYKSTIVFNNWTNLWESLLNFFNNDKMNKEFGNFGEISKYIDDFNDGNSSTRILNFLNDLNFNKNLQNRKKIIEYTVSKYADRWGKDKVFKV